MQENKTFDDFTVQIPRNYAIPLAMIFWVGLVSTFVVVGQILADGLGLDRALANAISFVVLFLSIYPIYVIRLRAQEKRPVFGFAMHLLVTTVAAMGGYAVIRFVL